MWKILSIISHLSTEIKFLGGLIWSGLIADFLYSYLLVLGIPAMAGAWEMVGSPVVAVALGLNDAMSWWDQINESTVWQDRTFHFLAALYGIVAAVALVLFSPLFFFSFLLFFPVDFGICSWFNEKLWFKIRILSCSLPEWWRNDFVLNFGYVIFLYRWGLHIMCVILLGVFRFVTFPCELIWWFPSYWKLNEIFFCCFNYFFYGLYVLHYVKQKKIILLGRFVALHLVSGNVNAM